MVATLGDGLTHAGERWPGRSVEATAPGAGERRKLIDGGDWKNGIFAAGNQRAKVHI